MGFVAAILYWLLVYSGTSWAIFPKTPYDAIIICVLCAMGTDISVSLPSKLVVLAGKYEKKKPLEIRKTLAGFLDWLARMIHSG
jgi:hypothetical protein